MKLRSKRNLVAALALSSVWAFAPTGRANEKEDHVCNGGDLLLTIDRDPARRNPTPFAQATVKDPGVINYFLDRLRYSSDGYNGVSALVSADDRSFLTINTWSGRAVDGTETFFGMGRFGTYKITLVGEGALLELKQGDTALNWYFEACE